jgi:hypothetical protein
VRGIFSRPADQSSPESWLPASGVAIPAAPFSESGSSWKPSISALSGAIHATDHEQPIEPSGTIQNF